MCHIKSSGHMTGVSLLLLLSEVPTPGPAAGWLEESRSTLTLSCALGAVQDPQQGPWGRQCSSGVTSRAPTAAQPGGDTGESWGWGMARAHQHWDIKQGPFSLLKIPFPSCSPQQWRWCAKSTCSRQLLGQERGNLLGDLGEILVPCADVE